MCLGEIQECFDQSKDFHAYGIMHNLYKMSPSISRLPLQIDYYETLMKTGRGEEANRLVDEILGVLKHKLKVDPKPCKRLAQRYFNEKRYFKAILLDLLGNHLLPDLKDTEKVYTAIQRNMVRLQKSIKKVCKECYSHKITVRLWILPRMRCSLQTVFDNARGKSKKMITVIHVACKHKLEIAEGYADDFSGVEVTLTEAKDLLTEVLGQEAKEMHLLGTLLNNLGANCLMQKRPQAAKDYLTEAIEVNMNAKDYDTDAEKERDIMRSSRALSRAEDMLRNQQS